MIFRRNDNPNLSMKFSIHPPRNEKIFITLITFLVIPLALNIISFLETRIPLFLLPTTQSNNPSSNCNRDYAREAFSRGRAFIQSNTVFHYCARIFTYFFFNEINNNRMDTVVSGLLVNFLWMLRDFDHLQMK